MTNLSADQLAAIESLEAIADELRRHEAEAAEFRADRTRAIQAALAAGVPKQKVAAAAGVHRSRLYALLDAS